MKMDAHLRHVTDEFISERVDYYGDSDAGDNALDELYDNVEALRKTLNAEQENLFKAFDNLFKLSERKISRLFYMGGFSDAVRFLNDWGDVEMAGKSLLWVTGPTCLADIVTLNISERHYYVVERVIKLMREEYENFISDFLVSRDFLIQHAKQCRVDENGVWHCLCVLQRGMTDGVLVMADEQGFIKHAAYLQKGADQLEE